MSDFDFSAYIDDDFSVPGDYDPAEDFDYAADYSPVEETAAPVSMPAEVPAPVSEDDIEKELSTLVVPAFMTGRLWSASDYAPFVNGSGAEKLAASAVAPLVAFARGYHDLTKENRSDTAKTYKFALSGSPQAMRLKRAAVPAPDGPGAMWMPWFNMDDIQKAEATGKTAQAHIAQFRPALPEVDGAGKVLKYEAPAGQSLPRDLHPGVPADYIDNTKDVVFAEGLLKGDAALSAYLLAHGVNRDELTYEDGMTVEEAREDLRAMFLDIPQDQRVLIQTFASVTLTDSDPRAWRGMQMKGRRGIIAFDADVSSNLDVWRQADRLRSAFKARGMEALLLSPQVTSGDAGEFAKIGVDDYLADHGDWNSLWAKITKDFPESPLGKDQKPIGTYRVDPDGCSVSKSTPAFDTAGVQTGVFWDQVEDFGGRILGTTTRRYPTAEEIRTGKFGVGLGEDVPQPDVEIEIRWKKNGEVQSHIVTGPAKLLNYAPGDWPRHDATIPVEVLLHESWPPESGMKWLSAVKGYKADEQLPKTSWNRMGWVPVKGQVPVYITPSAIICDPGTDPYGVSICGVRNSMVNGAEKFGVGTDPDADWDDEGYRESARKSFTKVIDTYIASKAWKNPAHAAVVIASAYRPAIPLPIRSTLFLAGAAGSGKSWTASAMMAPHAAREGSWARELPGSAKDTAASIELARAKVPFWVVDDIAPSDSQRQSENETAKASDMVRAAFNGGGKRRSNVQMKAQEVHESYALTAFTAENELQVASARSRYIPLLFGPGALHEDPEVVDAVAEMRRHGNDAPALNVAMISFIRWQATSYEGGWETYYRDLEEKRNGLAKIAEIKMQEMGAAKGTTARTAELAADIMITLAIFREMALELKMPQEFVKQFHHSQLGALIVKLLTTAHQSNSKVTPGRSLLEALRTLLASGAAHVVHVEDTATPPVKDVDDGDEDTGKSSSYLNSRLGWRADNTGTMRPVGNSVYIGSVVNHAATGEQVILFDPTAAFDLAKSKYSSLVKAGTNGADSWNAIWNEGIAFDGWSRQKNKTGDALLNTVQIRQGAGVRPRGIPITVDMVVNGVPDSDQDDNAETNDN